MAFRSVHSMLYKRHSRDSCLVKQAGGDVIKAV